MGATQPRLCFDPDDPAFPVLAGFPDIITVCCAAALSAGFGLTPDFEFRQRQIAALAHGYRAVTGAGSLLWMQTNRSGGGGQWHSSPDKGVDSTPLRGLCSGRWPQGKREYRRKWQFALGNLFASRYRACLHLAS